METIYEGPVATAKRVRAILKKEFPGQKFSVTSSKYAGGSSVHVDWYDGPFTKDVEAKVKFLESADFDGMQDLKTYKQVPALNEKGELVNIHGADFILCQRSISDGRWNQIRAAVPEYWAQPEAEKILKFDDWTRLRETETWMIRDGKLSK